MSRNFEKIGNMDVLPLLLEVQSNPQLWNKNPARLSENGPHYQTDDIWLRYNDETKHKESGDYSTFNDVHDSVWYPSINLLPSARKLIFDLMTRVQGERLGGVLINRIPPGKEVLKHIDSGWHVDYYDKFNINLKSQPGCRFFYDEDFMEPRTGEVYWFTNTKSHWVKNESNEDQIVLIVCIRLLKEASCRLDI